MGIASDNFDAYFAPLASTLEGFARRHALVLEKYYHEAPLWSLCFGHPEGGQAKIDVSKASESQVCIQGVWWVDDYKSFSRSLIWGEKRLHDREPAAVAAAIERAFAEVLAWKPGAWTQVATGYERHWSGFTEERFARFANPWPLPKL